MARGGMGVGEGGAWRPNRRRGSARARKRAVARCGAAGAACCAALLIFAAAAALGSAAEEDETPERGPGGRELDDGAGQVAVAGASAPWTSPPQTSAPAARMDLDALAAQRTIVVFRPEASGAEDVAALCAGRLPEGWADPRLPRRLAGGLEGATEGADADIHCSGAVASAMRAPPTANELCDAGACCRRAFDSAALLGVALEGPRELVEAVLWCARDRVLFSEPDGVVRAVPGGGGSGDSPGHGAWVTGHGRRRRQLLGQAALGKAELEGDNDASKPRPVSASASARSASVPLPETVSTGAPDFNSNTKKPPTNLLISPSCEAPVTTSWALDRIDQRRRIEPGGAAEFLGLGCGLNDTGLGTYVYVIDTGVDALHAEFRTWGDHTRVVGGRDFVNERPAHGDSDGHGTAVAALAAGATVGVAPGATVVPLRALSSGGKGLISDLLDALAAVARERVQRPGSPAVVLLSLTTDTMSRALELAIDSVVALGAVVVVAAGQASSGSEGGDACLTMPGAMTSVISVSGTDRKDVFMASANSGPCVDLLAPAVDVRTACTPPARCARRPPVADAEGTDLVSEEAFRRGHSLAVSKFGSYYTQVTGTSFAAPLVAGVVACVLSRYPFATPEEVRAFLLLHATRDAVRGVPEGRYPNSPTPNLLVHSVLSDLNHLMWMPSLELQWRCLTLPECYASLAPLSSGGSGGYPAHPPDGVPVWGPSAWPSLDVGPAAGLPLFEARALGTRVAIDGGPVSGGKARGVFELAKNERTGTRMFFLLGGTANHDLPASAKSSADEEDSEEDPVYERYDFNYPFGLEYYFDGSDPGAGLVMYAGYVRQLPQCAASPCLVLDDDADPSNGVVAANPEALRHTPGDWASLTRVAAALDITNKSAVPPLEWYTCVHGPGGKPVRWIRDPHFVSRLNEACFTKLTVRAGKNGPAGEGAGGESLAFAKESEQPPLNALYARDSGEKRSMAALPDPFVETLSGSPRRLYFARDTVAGATECEKGCWVLDMDNRTGFAVAYLPAPLVDDAGVPWTPEASLRRASMAEGGATWQRLHMAANGEAPAGALPWSFAPQRLETACWPTARAPCFALSVKGSQMDGGRWNGIYVLDRFYLPLTAGSGGVTPTSQPAPATPNLNGWRPVYRLHDRVSGGETKMGFLYQSRRWNDRWVLDDDDDEINDVAGVGYGTAPGTTTVDRAYAFSAELAAVHANRAQATTWAMRPGSLSSLGSDGGGGGGGDGVGDGAREDSTSGTGDGDAAREDKRPWPLERLVIRCVEGVGF